LSYKLFLIYNTQQLPVVFKKLLITDSQMTTHLPPSTQTLYAQLLDEVLHAAFSARGISFVTREIKQRSYWYMQYTIGSSQRSYYLGSDTEVLRKRIEAARHLWAEDAPSAKNRSRLVAMLRAGGATSLPSMHSRVLEALEQAGVFLVGGVLVGSHAYALMANALGVSWPPSTMRTQDVDLAHDMTLHVTVPDRQVDLEEALREADKAFFPVPALNRKEPSTTFKIRGSDLSVSLLTPMLGKPDSGAKLIPSLNAMASPLRFLDYLLEDIQPAVVPIRQGVLVNIPSPARFALHKLVISQRRPASFAVKARKDILQAQEVLRVLLEERPGDILLAHDAAELMPPKFLFQLRQGLSQTDEETQKRMSTLLS